MSISPAIPSPIAAWVLHFASQLNADNVSAGCSALEAGFYSNIKAGTLKLSAPVKWLRTTSVAYLFEIQTLFNLANAGQIAYFGISLAKNLQTHFSCSLLPIVGGMGATAVLIGAIMYNCYPTPPPAQTIAGCKVKEHQPLSQYLSQFLYTCKTIIVLGNTFFDQKTAVSSLINVAATAYSFIKNYKIKWIDISKGSQLNHERISHAQQTYHLLVLEPTASCEESICNICTDEETLPDMAFCINHLAHRNCIIQSIAAKGEHILDGSRAVLLETKYYTNGVHTNTSHQYEVTLQEDNLPGCPNCGTAPLQNTYSLTLTDRYLGKLSTSVSIKRAEDNQKLFEKFYTFYSIAQAGLAYLQSHPELASSIYKIQEILLIADIVFLGATCAYLYKRVQNKMYPETGNVKPSTAFHVASAVAGLATFVLSVFASRGLQSYFRPTITLNELVKQLPEDLTKEANASWTSPLTHSLLQILTISRMVTLAALSFFSKQKRWNLLSLASQGYSLFGLSNLCWIQIDQTLQAPLGEMVKKGATLTTNLVTSSLKSLGVHSTFLVDRSCTKDPIHLTSSLKSMFATLGRLFDKSGWDRYWVIHTQNGLEIGRKIHFDVKLQPSTVDPCGCHLITYLYKLSLSAYDSTFGNAVVNHSFAKP